MAIRVRGTLSIQRKNSARGAFNIGDLATEIGEFEVKDSLIEEFEPGKYTGEFIIRWIAPDSFSWRGRVFVKNRATLEEILIDEADEGAPAPSTPPEPDPIEQAPAAAPRPPAAPPSQEPATQSATPVKGARSKSASTTKEPADGDAELFGEELLALLQQRSPIKLDPTVDREQFRRQRDRLKVIGYSFDAKAQTWSIKEMASA
ncbi:MAG: hypothetical protein CFE44_02735 [Burkholderiales bacterium PBB4]|nr:MAG: hypothetical protein CFE44_02735 [Burkholderiales bacterium PBB4]